MIGNASSHHLGHQQSDSERGNLLEESGRMCFGAINKILEQRFEIWQVLVSNNCMQLWMDKDAEIHFLALKH